MQNLIWLTALALAGQSQPGLDQQIQDASLQAAAARSAGDFDGYIEQSEIAYDLALAHWGDAALSTASHAQKFGEAVIEAEERGATLIEAETLDKAPVAFQHCIDIYGLDNNWDLVRGQCEIGLATVQVRLGEDAAALAALNSAEQSFSPLQSTNAIAAISLARALTLAAYIEAKGLNLSIDDPVATDEVKANRIVDRARRAKALLSVSSAVPEDVIARNAFAEAHGLVALRRYEESAAAFKVARDIYVERFGEQRYESVMAERAYQWTKGMSYSTDELENTEGYAREKPCLSVIRDNIKIEYCVQKRPLPKYPFESLIFNQRGFVFVQYDVATSGKVENAEIVAGWPGEAFDKAAMRSVRKWRFDPPKRQSGEIARVDNALSIMNFVIDQVSTEWPEQ